MGRVTKIEYQILFFKSGLELFLYIYIHDNLGLESNRDRYYKSLLLKFNNFYKNSFFIYLYINKNFAQYKKNHILNSDMLFEHVCVYVSE